MVDAKMVKSLREMTGAGMLDCKKALVETNGDMDKAVDYLREKGISKAAKKQERIAAEGLATVIADGNSVVVLEVNSETDFVAKNDIFKDLVTNAAILLLDSDATNNEEALALPTEDGTLNNTFVNLTAKIGEKLSFRRFEKITKTDNEVFGAYSHMGGRIVVLALIEGGTEDIAKDIAMHAAAMNPKYIKREDIPADVVEHEKSVLKEQAMTEGKPAEIAEKMVAGRLNKFYAEVCLEEQEFIKDGDITVKKFADNNGATIKTVIRYEVGEGLEKRNDNFAEEVMNQING